MPVMGSREEPVNAEVALQAVAEIVEWLDVTIRIVYLRLAMAKICVRNNERTIFFD